MHVDTEQLLQCAKGAVRDAGAVVMEYYKTHDISSEVKEDGSVVTVADKEADTVLQEKLGATHIPVLSEECLVDVSTEKLFWLVDPLDGTMDFMQQSGDFAVMVALVQESRPLVAVVFLPAWGVLYSAVRGAGAMVEKDGLQTPLHVSAVATPSQARMLVSKNHPSQLEEILQKDLRIHEVLGMGSNGVKLGHIAEGRSEFFINQTSHMGWWDLAGPQLILEEAGGRVTNTKGEALTYAGEDLTMPNGVIATNGLLHEALLAYVSTVRP